MFFAARFIPMTFSTYVACMLPRTPLHPTPPPRYHPRNNGQGNLHEEWPFIPPPSLLSRLRSLSGGAVEGTLFCVRQTTSPGTERRFLFAAAAPNEAASAHARHPSRPFVRRLTHNRWRGHDTGNRGKE